MDIDEDKINHNSMLKRLVEELFKDEAKVTAERTAVAVNTAQHQRDSAKAIREKKKQEAIERSKARQAQKDYFDAKKEANAEPQMTLVGEEPITAEDSEEEGKEDEIDPFRIGKPGRGPKIHTT